MAKRNFLDEVLSAHVLLKSVRPLSTSDDVTIGPCPMCVGETPVTLRKTDKILLKEVFAEEKDIRVCENCSITLGELRQLQLQKVKIERRIEQISSCIKAIVYKKQLIAQEGATKICETSNNLEHATIFYSKKSVGRRNVKKESPREQNNGLWRHCAKDNDIVVKESSTSKDPTGQILNETASSNYMELELTDEEIEEDAENHKIKASKLRVRQKCELCGKGFPRSALQRHLDNDCIKGIKLTGKTIPSLKPSNKPRFDEQAEQMDDCFEDMEENKPKSRFDKHQKLNPRKIPRILKKVVSNPKPRCNVCKRQFPNHQDAIRHKNRKVCFKTNYISISETFEKFCGICRMGFATKEELRRHKSNESCKKRQRSKGICGHCEKQFYGRSEVFKHLKSGECRFVKGKGK